MNAKDIWKQQQEAKLAAALRSGKSGMKLLDDSDNNIGNGILLQPNFLPFPGPGFIKQPSNTRQRLLNLTSDSKYGQSITVIMTASRTIQNVSLAGAYAGPITGVIEFGNGSQSTSVEFDVPIGPYAGNQTLGLDKTYEPRDGGVVIQVPTSTLRVFARYDNALITPIQDLFSPAFGEGAYPTVPPGAGPYAPNPVFNDPLGPMPGRTAVPVLVKAFANYFGRVFSRLQKTMYLYVGNPGVGPVPFSQAPGGSFVPYAIPPFARAVRVVRMPQTAAMELRLADGSAYVNSVVGGANVPFIEQYSIAAGPAPLIPIEGNHQTIALRSAGAGDLVTGVKLVYEIGF